MKHTQGIRSEKDNSNINMITLHIHVYIHYIRKLSIKYKGIEW